MKLDLTVMFVILGCALVTWVPRIIPFVVVRKMNLPAPVLTWLSYIPICLFAALIVKSGLVQTEGTVEVDWKTVGAIVPTLFVAIWTKSLLASVLFGVSAMAIIRYFF